MFNVYFPYLASLFVRAMVSDLTGSTVTSTRSAEAGSL